MAVNRRFRGKQIVLSCAFCTNVFRVLLNKSLIVLSVFMAMVTCPVVADDIPAGYTEYTTIPTMSGEDYIKEKGVYRNAAIASVLGTSTDNAVVYANPQYSWVGCNAGEYYIGNENCGSCYDLYGNDYPESKGGDGNSSSTCYRSCIVSDVANAAEVEGEKYANLQNTCSAVSCNANFYLDGGAGLKYCTACNKSYTETGTDTTTTKTCPDGTTKDHAKGTSQAYSQTCYHDKTTGGVGASDINGCTAGKTGCGSKTYTGNTCYVTSCDTGYKKNQSTNATSCIPNEYDVEYDGNGADSGSTEESHHQYGVESSLSANGFVKAGQAFQGWKTDDGTFVAANYNESKLSTVDGDLVVLYAQWASCDVCSGNTGAHCEVSAPGGECVYTTYCLGGYAGIENEGTKDVTCSLVGNGRYSPEGNNGDAKSCATETGSSDFNKSDSGRDSINDCYRNCKTTDVDNSSAVSGKFYYGATAPSACNATACLADTYLNNGECVLCSADTNNTATGNFSEAATSDTCADGSTKITHATKTNQLYTKACYKNKAPAGSTSKSACYWTEGDEASCKANSKTYGTCYVTECAEGYHLSSATNATSCVANTYTIKYNANATGATGSTADSTHTYNADKVLTANGFTNGTKKFLGWSTDSSATTATYTNGQSVKNLTSTNGGTVTLYAVWGDCTACSATNANCTLSAPAGVCTYTTSCLTGYNTLVNGGKYNPSCTVNTYTVKYDANATGATGSTANSSHTYDADKALTPNGFTNGTKKFLGWATSNTATTATYTNEQSVKNLTTTNGGTVTLYAVWTDCTACSATHANCTLTAPLGVCTYATSCKDGYNTLVNEGKYNPSCTANTYTVKYNANATGATGSTADSSHTYDAAKALTANGFTNGTKKFLGWATSANGAKAYNNAQSVSNLTTENNGTVTLFAVWEDCTACSATNANCELSAPLGVCTYATSCKDGYNTLVNSGKYNPSCTANTYTVKYSANGGSGNMADSTYTYDAVGQKLRKNSFANGTKVFEGWAKTSDGEVEFGDEGAVNNLTTTNNGSITLYAKWGICTACSATNANCTLTAPAGVCTYTTSCLTGYNTLVNAGKYNPSCTVNTYTVKYDANGGTGNMTNSDYTYDVAQALTANGFTNGTKRFLGWATSANGAKAYDNEQSVINLTATNNGTVTLYAVWDNCAACSANHANCTLTAPLGVCTYATSCKEGYNTLVNEGKNNPSCTANTYTVKYDANGGTGNMADSTYTYDAAGQKLRKNTFVYDTEDVKKEFLGWAKTNDATEPLYEDENGVNNWTNENGGEITLYAVWGFCKACSATNANCSLSASNGKCEYTTSCQAGYYNITNNGAYNVSCTEVETGYWSPDGDNSRHQCPAGFRDGSNKGKDEITDCYKMVTPVCTQNECTCPNDTTCECAACSCSGVKYTQYVAADGTSNGLVVGETQESCDKQVAGSTCVAGYYLNGEVCAPCAKGTYKAEVGNATSCTAASDGYYVSATAATSQTQCPAGYRDGSNNGRDDVTDCYKMVTPVCTQNECVCPADTECTCSACSCSGVKYTQYVASNGTSNGQVVGETQESCDKQVAGSTCVAGYYLNGAVCTPCAKGTYKAEVGNATSCTAASDGYYVSATAATSQTQCPAGYRDGSNNGRDDVTDCYKTVVRGCTKNEESVPNNCAGVAEWNDCSCSGETYSRHVAFDGMSDGDAEGVSENESCTKTPKTVTADFGAYVDGITCKKCPDGMVSPLGTTSVGGCGKKMYIDNTEMYLTSEKETSPALAVKIGGKVFYARTSAGAKSMSKNANKSLRAKIDGVEYSIHDNTVEEE